MKKEREIPEWITGEKNNKTRDNKDNLSNRTYMVDLHENKEDYDICYICGFINKKRHSKRKPVNKTTRDNLFEKEK